MAAVHREGLESKYLSAAGRPGGGGEETGDKGITVSGRKIKEEKL